MKKRLSLILVTCMTVSLLAACGTDGKTPAGTTDGQSEQTQPTTQAAQTTLPELSREAVIEETVLVDEEDVRITATSLTYGHNGIEVELLLENNSERELRFVSESIGYSVNAINGFMAEDGYLNSEVAAGKKAYETVRFSNQMLTLCGIREIADIELGFDISDENYNHFHTGPRQILTSAFEWHDYGTDHFQAAITDPAVQQTARFRLPWFSTETVYDENGVRVCAEGLLVNKNEEQILLLELENNKNQTVHVEASDVTLNGLAVYDYSCGGITLTPGNRGLLEVELSAMLDPALRELFGIREIGSVGLSLRQIEQEGEELSPNTPLLVQFGEAVEAIDLSGPEVLNADGLRIISKGIVKDPSSYSEDLHVLLLVENNTGAAVKVDEQYESLSVNGMMTDDYFSGTLIENGMCGVVDITLEEGSLEKNKIKAPEDITELEIGIEVWQNRDIIGEQTLHITY